MARSRKPSPCFYLIAGPNGSGKTTFAMTFLPRYARTYEFLNADLIAKGLSPLRPEAAAISAYKIVLKEMDRLAAALVNFAAETTLTGKGYIERVRRFTDLGYHCHLYFLWLPLPLAIERVADRVRAGGHAVPVNVIVRRHEAGLRNLSALDFGLFQEVRLLDNTGAVPRDMAIFVRGRWQWIDPTANSLIEGARS